MRISRFVPTCALTACAALASAQTFTLVHVFHGTDGADPASAGMVEDSSGNLYSTTAFGGSSGLGTVYRIDRKANNKETVLHNFTGGSDGQNPNAGVLLGSDGNLYGTANGGGANGFGTAFSTTPAGAFNAFYQFQGGAQAAFPGRLIAGSNAFYGPSGGGGAPFFGGLVYRLDNSGETDLYTFANGADGSSGSWLIRDSAGNFYGTGGGGDLTCSPPGGCGVIYKIGTKGVYSVLHIFVGPDGRYPSGLTIDPAGNLFGTTVSGGAHDAGTVFELTPSGQVTTLYSFSGAADGAQPQAGVIRDPAGNLYGTAYLGGTVTSQCFNQGCGLVFMLSPTASGPWKETVLHSFTGPDGYGPLGPLLLDPSQPALYGTTYAGGDFTCTTLNGGSSCGVVFKIAP